MKNETNFLQWEINVPIFKNLIILRQLAVAIGLPFGLLFIFLFAVMRDKIISIYTLYALVLIGAVFLLTFIFIMVVYCGKYSAGFIINDKGILNYTQKKQRKKNLIINLIAVILGLFSGKPAVAGAGVLAQSKQEVFIKLIKQKTEAACDKTNLTI